MTESVVTAPPDCPVSAGGRADARAQRRLGRAGRGVGGPWASSPTATWRSACSPTGATASDPAEAHASSPVHTGEPEMDVHEAAADLMVSHGVRRLPVVEGRRMVGILTLDDLAVRTGDLDLAPSSPDADPRAVMPDFYFFARGRRGERAGGDAPPRACALPAPRALPAGGAGGRPAARAPRARPGRRGSRAGAQRTPPPPRRSARRGRSPPDRDAAQDAHPSQPRSWSAARRERSAWYARVLTVPSGAPVRSATSASFRSCS